MISQAGDLSHDSLAKIPQQPRFVCHDSSAQDFSDKIRQLRVLMECLCRLGFKLFGVARWSHYIERRTDHHGQEA